MTRMLLMSFVTLLIIPALATAVDCRTDKSGNHYWSWRMVDGKRCWYEGKPGLDKSQLHWTHPVKAERIALDTKPTDPWAPLVPNWVKTLQVLPPGIVELTPQQRIDADFNMLFIDQAQITGDTAGFIARLREVGRSRLRDYPNLRGQ